MLDSVGVPECVLDGDVVAVVEALSDGDTDTESHDVVVAVYVVLLVMLNEDDVV